MYMGMKKISETREAKFLIQLVEKLHKQEVTRIKISKT